MSVDKSNRMRQKKDDFLTIGMMVLNIGTGTRTSSTCDINFYAQFPIRLRLFARNLSISFKL